MSILFSISDLVIESNDYLSCQQNGWNDTPVLVRFSRGTELRKYILSLKYWDPSRTWDAHSPRLGSGGGSSTVAGQQPVHMAGASVVPVWHWKPRKLRESLAPVPWKLGNAGSDTSQGAGSSCRAYEQGSRRDASNQKVRWSIRRWGDLPPALALPSGLPPTWGGAVPHWSR